MRIDSLEQTPFQAIHTCFTSAFQDYAVGMAAVTQSALQRRALKNNWVPGLSCGAWEGQNLVAITLVGVDNVAGEKIAYDICTGVVPEYRGQGLAGAMLTEISPGLCEKKISAMHLEVLEENTAAISAYKKAGFRESRKLVSYSGSAAELRADLIPYCINQISIFQFLELTSEQDFQPSFEQRDQAIRVLEDELIIQGAFLDNQLLAAIVHDPFTGWLMRVVTRKTQRRQGAASALLQHLAGQLQPDAPVKAINIDGADSNSQALMKSIGMQKLLGQLEMRLELA